MSPAREQPEYTVYRSRPALLRRRARADDLGVGGPPRPPRGGDAGWRRWVRPRRVLALLAAAVAGWLLLSLLLFVVSAQIERAQVSDGARDALDPAGYPLTSANTILVLGSDRRTEETQEPGSSTSGPSRSDSILLLRVGGGHSARLSIPRDTVVDISGHGPDKVNAAYAIGFLALAITPVEQYLGV